MKAFNQAYWTVVHLPFHIALVLLSEGASQWAVWWRAMESFSEAEGKLLESVEDSIGSEHTSDVVKALQKTTYSILEEYGSDILDGGKDADDLEETFKKLKDNIPDDYWSDTDDSSDKILEMWAEGYAAISSTVINAISDAFDISVIEEEKSTVSAAWDEEEREAVGRTAKRLWLIVRRPDSMRLLTGGSLANPFNSLFTHFWPQAWSSSC